jgi:hypothetical protein
MEKRFYPRQHYKSFASEELSNFLEPLFFQTPDPRYSSLRSSLSLHKTTALIHFELDLKDHKNQPWKETTILGQVQADWVTPSSTTTKLSLSSPKAGTKQKFDLSKDRGKVTERKISLSQQAIGNPLLTQLNKVLPPQRAPVPMRCFSFQEFEKNSKTTLNKFPVFSFWNDEWLILQQAHIDGIPRYHIYLWSDPEKISQELIDLIYPQHRQNPKSMSWLLGSLDFQKLAKVIELYCPSWYYWETSTCPKVNLEEKQKWKTTQNQMMEIQAFWDIMSKYPMFLALAKTEILTQTKETIQEFLPYCLISLIVDYLVTTKPCYLLGHIQSLHCWVYLRGPCFPFGNGCVCFFKDEKKLAEILLVFPPDTSSKDLSRISKTYFPTSRGINTPIFPSLVGVDLVILSSHYYLDLESFQLASGITACCRESKLF